ncbi:hypothetical protein MMARV_C013P5 [viral metagenome]|uniref:Uncharacterized protein n=1 Tax=viral metagenome TaxID=1070528 RepID=A0A6L2ZJ74_9ZZZZ
MKCAGHMVSLPTQPFAHRPCFGAWSAPRNGDFVLGEVSSSTLTICLSVSSCSSGGGLIQPCSRPQKTRALSGLPGTIRNPWATYGNAKQTCALSMISLQENNRHNTLRLTISPMGTNRRWRPKHSGWFSDSTMPGVPGRPPPVKAITSDPLLLLTDWWMFSTSKGRTSPGVHGTEPRIKRDRQGRTTFHRTVTTPLHIGRTKHPTVQTPLPRHGRTGTGKVSSPHRIPHRVNATEQLREIS